MLQWNITQEDKIKKKGEKGKQISSEPAKTKRGHGQGKKKDP